MSFLSRYQAGQHADVWADLVALNESVRGPEYFEDAYAVARETMQRVRRNVETVHQQLLRVGYHFADPAQAHVPPTDKTPIIIHEVERLIGYLPLSLRALYEEVGSVDFRQSTDQLVHYYEPERAHTPEINILGEEDPLVVASIQKLLTEAQQTTKRLYFCFAPDEFHKANYSGGENYHVWLPDARADFRIEGMYGINEYFVAYLQATFRYGGFRGRVETLEEDEERCHQVTPQLHIITQLATNLVPF